MSLMSRIRLEQQTRTQNAAGEAGKSGRDRRVRSDPFKDMKSRIHTEIVQEIDPQLLDSKENTDLVRQTVENLIIEKLAQEEKPLSRSERSTRQTAILADARKPGAAWGSWACRAQGTMWTTLVVSARRSPPSP